MTNLRVLVESTGVGIIAITHLKRPSQGKGHEEGGRVTLAQLRGSGAIAQLSDFVIGLERNQQVEAKADICKLRVLKSRRGGRTGIADDLAYNPITGRLLPTTLRKGGTPTSNNSKGTNDDF